MPQERIYPFDRRLDLIEQVIKPGYAALALVVAGEGSGSRPSLLRADGDRRSAL